MGTNSDQKQTKQILDYIQKFGSITPLEALADLGIMRLASRIDELRKAGYPITTTMIPFVTRLGKTSRYAKYELEEFASVGDAQEIH